MSIIRPVRPPLVAPVVSPFGLGLPWQSGGGGGTRPGNRPPITASLIGDWNSSSPTFYVLNTGLVQTALDQSGTGNDLTQGTAGNRPVIAAAGGPGGGMDAFDFTLAAGLATFFLKNALTGIGTGVPATVYSIAQAPTNNRYLHDGSPGADQRLLCGLPGDAAVEIYAGAAVIAGPTVAGQWTVFAGVFNGASSAISINGGAQVTGTTGAGAQTGHVMGGRAGGAAANGLNAKMTRQLLYAAAHSAAEVAQVVAYLRAWGGV